MKSSYSTLTVVLLLSAFLSFGQDDERAKSYPEPIITKGYYSIGNHSQKLNVNRWPSPDTLMIPVITKGYYSISSNNKMAPKKWGWFRKDTTRPVIKKGYYSIGIDTQKINNSKK